MWAFPRSQAAASTDTDQVSDIAMNSSTSTTAVSERLKQLLSDHSTDQVARRLSEVGFDVSAETVRRYREGLAQRIDALFVAAVAEAYKVDLDWLLRGRTPKSARVVAGTPFLTQETGSPAPQWLNPARYTRLGIALQEVAVSAFKGYVGRVDEDREEDVNENDTRQMWRNTIASLLGDISRAMQLDEATSHLLHSAALGSTIPGEESPLRGKTRATSIVGDLERLAPDQRETILAGLADVLCPSLATPEQIASFARNGGSVQLYFPPQ